MMIVALGAPVLMGTTGLAVDTAQWYLWKRELQYAADQAALAGAWARGNGDTGTEYYTRARQEFSANIAITTNYTTLDEATLADYDGGTQNSVVVSASTTGTLPFANLFLGRATTVRVNAQAIYETTPEWTACLLALDEDASKALYFNGGPNVNAACGVGAISDADNAIAIDGTGGTYDVGWAISGGGVDDKHGDFGDATIAENLENLEDPFDDLTPPDNPIGRTLTCGSATATWTADSVKVQTETYNYYRGQNAQQANSFDGYAEAKSGTTLPAVTTTGVTYTTLPVNNTSTTSTGLYQVSGSGPDKIFEEKSTRITTTYSNIVAVSASTGSQLPGTYRGFNITCDTTLESGIYVIDGGTLNVNATYSLRGSGVMFVLKNGAGIQINGGAAIDLSPMTAAQLIVAGVSPEDAERLAGMLIFEDPESSGSRDNVINGNASTNLNGVVYTPNSPMTLLGSMHAEVECLMVASKTLQIGGSANLATFCPAGDASEIVVGGGETRVRLVA